MCGCHCWSSQTGRNHTDHKLIRARWAKLCLFFERWTHPPPRYQHYDHIRICCLYCGWAVLGRPAGSSWWQVQCREPSNGRIDCKWRRLTLSILLFIISDTDAWEGKDDILSLPFPYSDLLSVRLCGGTLGIRHRDPPASAQDIGKVSSLSTILPLNMTWLCSRKYSK